jgi:hypothetical protein
VGQREAKTLGGNFWTFDAPSEIRGGLLGHLDAGGHFYVKQEEVQPDYWELTVLDVDMKGKALFFKTIGVQEEMKRSMFRRVRDDLSAAQGANLLYEQVPTTSKISAGQLRATLY